MVWFLARCKVARSGVPALSPCSARFGADLVLRRPMLLGARRRSRGRLWEIGQVRRENESI
jgi:hypothetical protein